MVFRDTTPIYLQIAEQIRESIVAGSLRPGEQVMSTNQYSAFHRVNPATAGKAFQVLVEEGVLEKRRGVGMFVASGADGSLRARRRTELEQRYVTPLLEEAHRLGLTIDEVLATVRAQANRRGARP